MTAKHLIDPELLPGLELFPGMRFSAEILPQVRTQSAAARAPVTPDPAVRITELRVPGPDGAPDVRLLLFTPVDVQGLKPAVFHIHGGGYVLGEPEMNVEQDVLWAKELGCVIVGVDYRLAPETAHPGPLEDCYAVLRWLYREAAALGVDRKRIALLGESAGGGLAAALSLLARDRAQVPLAYQALIAPMIDDRTCTMSAAHAHVGEFVWTRENNRFGWASLLGCDPGGADVSPYAAAARATDLAGLPPTFISVGALDLFLEEDLDYARRLTRAGVPVELHVYPGAYHGFERFAPQAPIVRRAIQDRTEGLRRALCRS